MCVIRADCLFGVVHFVTHLVPPEISDYLNASAKTYIWSVGANPRHIFNKYPLVGSVLDMASLNLCWAFEMY